MSSQAKKTVIIEKKSNIKVSAQKTKEKPQLDFAFGKTNYQLLVLGVIFLLIGYILMIGGGSNDPNVFSDKIFDFQRLTLAPILLIIGFVIEVFAIMIKPKE